SKRDWSSDVCSSDLAWFQERGIELKTESDGRIFPVTDDSSTIINCLKAEAQKHNVEVRTKTRVETISPNADGRYLLNIRRQEPLTADAVVIATGGSNRSSTYDSLRD